MDELRIGERLKDLLFDITGEKERASENGGSVVARRWAVLYTELEKALAYYKAFLESKESE
jgi:hypothetical protein